ncbi:MAG: putative ABC transporter ATP-binding protein YxlF [Alphaproteobacteria bacterium MarineAlpha11_Bin1]|nr:MAG: putative ABC transporter ATP-binding protein YxlF [Alphaproteobacteria bacterium MarineAlpha11_Bin1]|tara:strand:+ start:11027 stop:11986 length:960 start_codon:yes stop_codon:yes gene_type:complete
MTIKKMLEIKSLTKEFGHFKAVDDVSLSVDSGEVLGFLGPNGAGKSTTMKMVTGFLSPTSGTAIVCGADVTREPIEVKRHIGYLPEGAPLYEDMTPAGLLAFAADIRKLAGADRQNSIDNAVTKLQLDEVYNQQIGTLSKGFKRRVGLAQAILHDPDVLILDEPTDGLDPNQKHQVRALITEMAKDKAIVISTHLLEEVGAVCNRAVVIARGRKVADGTPTDLERRSGYFNSVSIHLHSDQVDDLRRALEGVEIVSGVEIGSTTSSVQHITVMSRDGADIIETVNSLIRENNIKIEQLYSERGRLDDVFRQITSDGGPQ